MKITDAGVGLSPWRRRVLPVMMLLLRAGVAWYVLRTPLYVFKDNALFLTGLAPHWARFVIIGLMLVGALAFVWPRSVVWGALVTAAGLCLFEYCWHRTGWVGHSVSLTSGLALLATLAAGEWLAQRTQRRVYGSVSR